MDNQVFYRVVAPTLATGSAFIGITTLGDDSDSNFVGKLIDTRDKEGNRLFRVINIELVCARCKRHGKELSCQHMMGEIPYWHDEKRHADLELMMRDHQDIFLREMKYVMQCVSSTPITTYHLPGVYKQIPLPVPHSTKTQYLSWRKEIRFTTTINTRNMFLCLSILRQVGIIPSMLS